jgi:hypothetical protein
MTRDDVIRMAREAGLKVGENLSGLTLIGSPLPMGLAHIDLDEMQRFATLVAAAEREACARVCEDINAKYAWPADIAERVASQWCADAIRARGDSSSQEGAA